MFSDDMRKLSEYLAATGRAELRVADCLGEVIRWRAQADAAQAELKDLREKMRPLARKIAARLDSDDVPS